MRDNRENLPDAGAGADRVVTDPKPGFSFQEFYNALVEENRPCHIEKGEFTCRQFAADAGISWRLAMYKLEALVEKGVLECRSVVENGKRMKAFRRKGVDD